MIEWKSAASINKNLKKIHRWLWFFYFCTLLATCLLSERINTLENRLAVIEEKENNE